MSELWHSPIRSRLFSSRWNVADERDATGKWLVRFPLGDPDGVEDAIWEATARGRFAAFKMSAARLDEILGCHMICVYCESSREDVVRQALETLREIGITGPLHYKTDRATAEGRDDHLWSSDDFEGITPEGLGKP